MAGGITGTLVGVDAPGRLGFATGFESFYGAIDRVAMTGTRLQAPLAALFALLVITANRDRIPPAMLLVATAKPVARQLLDHYPELQQLRRLADQGDR